MDLCEDMIWHEFERYKVYGDGPEWREDMDGWVEMKAFQALVKIKRILEDDSLRDEECFGHIEKIVSLFEDLGSGCGSRHDFG